MGVSLIQPSTPNGFSTPHNSMDAKAGCRCVDVDMWNAQGTAQHNEWASSTRSVQEVHRNSLPKYINLRFPVVCTCRSTYHTGLRKFADLKNRRQAFVKPPDDLEFIFSKPLPPLQVAKGSSSFFCVHLSEKSCLGSETAIPSDCQPLRSSITNQLKAFCYWF